MKRTILMLSLFSCTEYNLELPKESSRIPSEVSDLDSELVEERFVSPAPAPADIAVFVDHSCSMGDNRVEWNDNMPLFVETLEDNNVDYRLAVTSTNSQDTDAAGVFSTLPDGTQWVSYGDPDPADTFVSLENIASGPGESGLDSARAALIRRNGKNSEFFRKKTPLFMITISDEPDRSLFTTTDELIREMERYERQYDSVISYSAIVHLTNSTLCYVDPLFVGHGYLETREQWGFGTVTDICSSDWSEPVREIAEHIGHTIRYEYNLHTVPIPETIEVYVTEDGVTFFFTNINDFQDGEPLVRGFKPTWEFNTYRNSVVLTDFVPRDDTIVDIKYYSAAYYTPEDND